LPIWQWLQTLVKSKPAQLRELIESPNTIAFSRLKTNWAAMPSSWAWAASTTSENKRNFVLQSDFGRSVLF
jgi:hypothetical protein